MPNYLVDVTKEGAVLLGPDLVCDGYFPEQRFRVQSHLHDDHLKDFSASKQDQTIILSPESYELLIAIKNADIPDRQNVISLSYGKSKKVGYSYVKLFSSGHILGSVQTQVTLPDGRKAGYSGDFNWPLDNIIKVDTLVVDATYGKPDWIRDYTKDEAHEKLVEIVRENIRNYPIDIQAYSGTLQRIVHIISLCDICVPIIAEEKIYNECIAYRGYGFNFDALYDISTSEGRRIKKSENYIMLSNPFTQNPTIRDRPIVTIQITKYKLNQKGPVLKYSDFSYKIGISDHADFEETLQYVKATGAEKVITDSSRSDRALQLAISINERFGIEAIPSSEILTNHRNCY